MGFPQPPKQEQVLEWCFDLQRQMFADQRGFFYTTHNRALPGSDAKRQLDLFVKRNETGASSRTHNWTEVCVVGESKAMERCCYN
jgi:hypothetical protein